MTIAAYANHLHILVSSRMRLTICTTRASWDSFVVLVLMLHCSYLLFHLLLVRSMLDRQRQDWLARLNRRWAQIGSTLQSRTTPTIWHHTISFLFSAQVVLLLTASRDVNLMIQRIQSWPRIARLLILMIDCRNISGCSLDERWLPYALTSFPRLLCLGASSGSAGLLLGSQLLGWLLELVVG